MWPFDPNNQQMYQQYAQAYNTGNYNGIDQNQALGHMQQFVQNAPPDLQHQVYQQHFEQMPYDQRMQFAQQVPQQYAMAPNNPQAMAQGFYQMGQQQPNMLSKFFGQGGMLGNPMVSGGIGALVGIAAASILGHQGGGGMFGEREGYGGGGMFGERDGYGGGDYDGGGFDRGDDGGDRGDE